MNLGDVSMKRDIYFENMRETSRIVMPLIRELYSEFQSTNPLLKNSLDLILQRRIKNGECLLRPYLTRLSYEVSGGNYWRKIIKACAAMEILNISTYQSNLAFDGKNGVISNDEKNKQFISSMISFDLAVKSIMKLSESFGKKIIFKIIERVYEVNTDIYIGQFYDLNNLNISNLDFSMSLEEYQAVYIFRCEKLGGSLTSLCFEIGSLLAGSDNMTQNNIKEIGKLLGTARQMINDIADFVTLNEEYEEPLIDIKNGKVTYPIFHLIKYGSSQYKQFILDFLNKDQQFKLDEMKKLTKILYNSGSIRNFKKLIISYYKNLKEKVKKLPPSPERDLLSLSFSSLLTNKYFAILRQYGYQEKYKGKRVECFNNFFLTA